MAVQTLAPTYQLTDFVSLAGVPGEIVHELLELAAYQKRRGRTLGTAQDAPLRGRSVALLFEKPSLASSAARRYTWARTK